MRQLLREGNRVPERPLLGVPRAGRKRREQESKDPRGKMGSFNKHVLAGTQRAETFRARFSPFRDLGRCPVRPADPLCTQTNCAFRETSNAHRRGTLSRSSLRQQPVSENGMGRPRLVIVPKVCHACLGGEDSPQWRHAGGYFEAWELLFARRRPPRAGSRRESSPRSLRCV